METINGVERWPGKGPLFLALGNFDGVHFGHQHIIMEAVNLAGRYGGVSAMLIFDPHPVKALRPEIPFPLLTDIVDRADLAGKLGLHYLIVEPFLPGLAALTPELFVKNILLEKLKVTGVVIGSDYTFGHGGKGRAETMRALGERLGFKVEVCPLCKIKDRVVSSSAIRGMVREGRMREAAEMLNYYFFRRGRVIKGQGIGKKAVFPTANLSITPALLWPGNGVYLTAVDGAATGCRFGVTNVGGKPTFGQTGMSVETHILNFSGDIYGRELRLYFLEKLRETVPFATVELLRARIEEDIAGAAELIRTKFKDFDGGFLRPVSVGCF